MHKISDEFEFRPNPTTDYGVSCPWASKKIPLDLQWENGVPMLARSYFIKSSSKLLVTRTGIKAWSSSILGRIRPLILELLALEWGNISHFWTWISLKPVGQSWSNFVCSSTGVGERLHKVLGQIRSLRWAIVALWATCFLYTYCLTDNQARRRFIFIVHFEMFKFTDFL